MKLKTKTDVAQKKSY